MKTLNVCRNNFCNQLYPKGMFILLCLVLFTGCKLVNNSIKGHIDNSSSEKVKMSISQVQNTITIREGDTLSIVIVFNKKILIQSSIHWLLSDNQTAFANNSGYVDVPSGDDSVLINLKSLDNEVYSQNQILTLNIYGDSENFENSLSLTIIVEEDDSPLNNPIFSLVSPISGSNTITNQTSNNMIITNDNSAVKWCVSETQSTRPLSGSQTCLGGLGSSNGWYTSRPTNYSLSSADGNKGVYLWIADSANNVNGGVIKHDIVLDTLAPANPTIELKDIINNSNTSTLDSTVNVVISGDTDALKWCLIEQDSALATPSMPTWNDSCFSTTKPTQENLDVTGSRKIFLFTQDNAGNISSTPGSHTINYSLNLSPVAVNDYRYVMSGGTGVSNIAVITNDSDPEAEAISVTGATNGTYGTTIINGDGTINYTLTDSNFYGVDSFNYTITDPRGATANGTVFIHVMTAFTWTGNGGDGLWNTNLNWCGSVLPSNLGCVGAASSPVLVGDVAVFDGTCTSSCNAVINGSYTLGRIELNSGFTGLVTVQNGMTLTLDNRPSFIQHSGVFNGGDITSNINLKEMQMDGGTFNAPGGILKVGDTSGVTETLNALILSGGTFNHSNGTVQLFGRKVNCGKPSFVLDLNVSLELYNVQLDSTTGCSDFAVPFEVTAGDVLAVNNQFTIIGGSFLGDIHLKGNLEIQAGSNMDRPSYGTLHMIGTGTQEITSTASGKGPIIYVNKTSGVVQPATGTTEIILSGLHILQGTFISPASLEFRYGEGTDNGVFNTFYVAAGQTFNHNSGTVKFDINNMTTNRYPKMTIDAVDPLTFNNVIVNGSIANAYQARSVIVSGTTSLSVIGDLIHDGGAIEGNVYLSGDYLIGNNAGGSNNTGNIYMDANVDQYYSHIGSGKGANLIVNKVGGSVLPDTGVTSFSLRSLSLQNGSFKAPIGTFEFYSYYTTYPTILSVSPTSTFDHNSGTIYVSNGASGCSAGSSTIDVNSSQTLNNLTIEMSQGCTNIGTVYLGAGDSVNLLGTLHMINGKLSGSWNLKGDLTVESTFDGGDANISLNGTALQSLASLGGILPNGLWSFSNSSNFILLSNFTLNTSNIQMISGDLNLNGFNLTGINDISTYSGTITKNGGLLDYATCSAGGCPPDDL